MSAPTLVGSAQDIDAGGISSIDVTLTDTVPATTNAHTSSIQIAVFATANGVTTPANGPTVASIVDNASGGSAGFHTGNPDNFVGGLLTGPSGDAGSPPVGILFHNYVWWVYNQLNIGDKITLSFEDFAPSGAFLPDFVHVALLSVQGLFAPRNVPYTCLYAPDTFDWFFGNNPTQGFATDQQVGSGTVLTAPHTLTAGPLAVQMGIQIQTPGTGSLTFNDGATVLDSFFDQGADHTSGIVGYLENPSGSTDMGITSDQSSNSGMFAPWVNMTPPSTHTGIRYCSAGVHAVVTY